MNYGQTGAASRDAPAQPATSTQGFVIQVRDLANRLSQIEESCRRNADRLTGATPPVGETKGPTAVPRGVLAELAEAIGDITTRIDALGNQVDRFDSV
jgi:hypothetical protein